MAGITHSAFRRLAADFGGYGALSTEMLSARAVCAENVASSPFTKKRPSEGALIYQLVLADADRIGRVVEKLSTLEPFCIDVNIGCSAPEIRRQGGGVALFEDRDRLRAVLAAVRRSWQGALTVKCRLGARSNQWQERFAARLKIIEDAGVDAVTVHPRFSDEKLKRKARHDLFPWIVAQTRLPVIGNGDVADAAHVRRLLGEGGCAGCMIGRMAVVKPWLFRELSGGGPVPIDYCDVWNRFYDYTCEDFPPEKAIGRVKEFSAYFAANFFFGHELYRRVQGAADLATLRSRANDFLRGTPALVDAPSVMGI